MCIWLAGFQFRHFRPLVRAKVGQPDLARDPFGAARPE
jgi:hypothetical protein